ncbi:MAG: glycosyltransferase family 4 protein [Beutenbergiaceae bacterium]
MTSSRNPRLLVVVPNGITGDSRVQKSAQSAARAGWEVTLMGTAGRRPTSVTSMGNVRVVRQQMTRKHHDAFEAANADRSAPLPRRVRVIARSARSALRAKGPLPKRLRHALGATARGLRHLLSPKRPAAVDSANWRKSWPVLLDWQESFAPVIAELAPDVIHSNDAIMLGTCSEAVKLIRAAGGTVGWLHDIHEYVSGVNWGSPEIDAAYRAFEREYIHDPDLLATVSPELADLLVSEYDLPSTPVVVRNTPISDIDYQGAGLRTVIGVDPGVPLLVSCGSIQPARGIQFVISALPQLPQVHLAIVTNATAQTPALQTLLDLAREVGVSDRVHTAPYVEPHYVPSYLSSADIGVFAGIKTANHEISLPTKFAEYLHARLPILTSDLRVCGAFVLKHGIGAVFEPSDPEALAVAVRTMLDDLANMRAAIAPDLLDELSWDRQAETFLSSYTDLSGLTPRPQADDADWTFSESELAGGGR